MSKTVKALIVNKEGFGKDATTKVKVGETTIPNLQENDVEIKTKYSSVNYKDGLATTPTAGFIKKWPHIPGIDVAGTISKSRHDQFKEGDEVIGTGFGIGAEKNGGYCERVVVPGEWLLHCPKNLSLTDAMRFGTAGFTAALAIRRLEENFITPDQGEILVTGASGGVGTMAVSMLSSLKYSVVASTGKTNSKEFLTNLGAKRILTREEINLEAKPIGNALWAGAIDQLGGNVLKWVLSTMKYRGACASTGLTLSPKFDSFVFPFIIRGVSLLGIDSVQCPMEERAELWKRMAGELKPDSLSSMGEDISLEDLPSFLINILKGKITGRTVVKI